MKQKFRACRLKKQSMISSEPFRKARTKTKKPKFLSLRLALSNSNAKMSLRSKKTKHRQQQLNLVPALPDQNPHHDQHDNINMAAYIFAEDDGGATTINAFLTEAVSSTSHNEEPLRYAHEEGGSATNSLVRTAMRNRERDTSEEKWVSITEVVERNCRPVAVSVEDEATSGIPTAQVEMEQREGGRLSLKLDYQQVLNEWSGKGPFYTEEESPQTVPDLHFNEGISQSCLQLSIDTNEGFWRVPNSSNDCGNHNSKVIGDIEGERWKTGLREASVLRYKEKRRSRLFSKRIRYEVRKLNAEKRPRIKGRFVKRHTHS